MTFRVTIQILTKIYGEQSLRFNTHWQCLKLTKKDCKDYTTFAITVNRYCERFQLNEITPDMFKCLIFLQGLSLPSEKEVRTRLLTKLGEDQKITAQSLAEKCQRILNLRADTAKIEERNISNIHTIKNKPQGKKINRFSKLFRVTGVENCIYLKTIHLNKRIPYLLAQRTRFLTLQTWRGKLFKKIFKKTKKKRAQYITEQATTEKVQRKYVNICLNNKKKNFR